MRTTEIEVGADYAYSHADYATRHKVTVLETGVERRQGWGSSGKRVRNGVRVRYQDGSEGIVSSREIREEWAPYAERKAAEAKYREESEARARQVRAERARQAKALDDYLAGHGEEARTVEFYDRKGVREALEAAGFETISTNGVNLAVKTRIKSIRDFVLDGEVKVDDLAPVLADLAIFRQAV